MTAITLANAHAYQARCLTRHMLAVLHRNACRSPKPDTRTFSTFVPQHVKEVVTSRDGPSIQTEVLSLWIVRP